MNENATRSPVNKKQHLLFLGEKTAQEGMLFHEFVAAKVGLNPTDMRAISLLRDSGPLTPGEIAKGMQLSASATTTVIDRLEQAGFVRRAPHETDRRKLVVTLDKKHMKKINRLYMPLFTDMERLFGSYDETELDILIDFHVACMAIFQEARKNDRG